MDPSENSQANKSPRSREILGPRPTPLRVRKDSHKIKKPPLAPPHHHQPEVIPPPQPPRAPVIIYTVSPKIIHTNPSDFMTLVQRLTGKTPSSTSTASSSSSSYASTSDVATLRARETTPFHDGSMSPAARYAATEKANNTSSSTSPIKNQSSNELGFFGGIDHTVHHHHHHHHTNQEQQYSMIERPSFIPGILSPGPTSLPLISPNFFSPATASTDPTFFNDISNILHQPSPSIPSPYSLDLFNNFFDS